MRMQNSALVGNRYKLVPYKIRKEFEHLVNLNIQCATHYQQVTNNFFKKQASKEKQQLFSLHLRQRHAQNETHLYDHVGQHQCSLSRLYPDHKEKGKDCEDPGRNGFGQKCWPHVASNIFDVYFDFLLAKSVLFQNLLNNEEDLLFVFPDGVERLDICEERDERYEFETGEEHPEYPENCGPRCHGAAAATFTHFDLVCCEALADLWCTRCCRV